MKLIKTINTAVVERLAEDAAGGAVGAGGMAGGMAMPLFSRLVKRTQPRVEDAEFEEEEVAVEPTKKRKGLKEHIAALTEFADDSGGVSAAADQSFDTKGIIAKLKGLENRESQDHRDTVTFGLEDDDGGLVRVIVKHEQAEDFEKALQALMADQDEDEARPEIAEVLFKLKDRFDLVDVQWPQVEEDEEEDVAVAGDPNDPNAAGDPNDPNAGGDELDASPDDMGGGGDTSSVESLLGQVIDMMKADAEARTAEARAKEAEAKNKEAEAIAVKASSRVKQEEQFLDMDTYNKAKKDEDKEAKRLAQLSKWKHDVGGDSGDDDEADFNATKVSLSAPEEEERSYRPRPQPTQVKPKQPRMRGKMHPHDIASFILNRVK